ncbi:ATP-grasp domain-containing protein [Lysobacter sp. K5869]|uniref:ATP-grasp domain-containing protein n=1 Tax=Lysobacter sp. K5869 TaxID=2820808 RepID=UPI001C060E55|nr:ATP-grasp domain-containing protein [Lysobacter sp. K5869]QWP78148.1 ATP-grasp domain-containing protein [Lysobacter sp. K5869]
MFRIAYIEQRGNDLEHEERLAAEALARRGIEVRRYRRKHIERRALPLDETCFVMGTAPCVQGAMKQLGIPVPAPNDYPAALRPWLRRKVWRETLGAVEAWVSEGARGGLFVKPAERLKTFTGRVFDHPGDLYYLGGASRRQTVWCSESVRWRSEFRAYVIGETVVALDHYHGDPALRPCERSIAEALRAYRDSGEAPAAYGIDFGVLDDGRTALVEANDGYALGAYDIGAEPYTDLLLARWAELMATRVPALV